jgi:glutamate racemase
VVGLACPLLVPLAEEGWTHGPIAGLVARRYLSELLSMDPDIDTLVLGCTHYPLLADELAAAAAELAGRDIAVVDSATAMAQAARAALGDQAAASGRGELGIFVTDASRLDELAPRFLGERVQTFELVDL